MKRLIPFVLLILCASTASADRASPQGGTVTGVTATAGGGVVIGGTASRPSVGLVTGCSATQVLVWSGSSWGCGTAGGVGTITGVTAGGGLTGGGTVGSVNLDIGAGTGIIVNANDIQLNMTAQTCGAGAFITSATATGVFGCASETGDITDVVAGNGLTGGGSSGSVTVDVACATGLTCSPNQIEITSRDFGDITTSSTGSVMTIDPATVTLAKMADVATARIFGRVTAATGVPEALTGTQATTLLDPVTTSVKGLVPTAPNDTTKFFRGDATWAVPPDLGAPSQLSTTISAQADNWAPTGFATAPVFYVSSATAGWTTTGISSSGSTAGRQIVIINQSGQTLPYANQNASSSAGNQLKTQAGITRTICNYGAIGFAWDGTYWEQTFEATHCSAELYSGSTLTVTTTSALLGAVSTFGSDTIGDTSGDALTVNSTASFQAALNANSTVTVATGQVIDVKTRARVALVTGSGTPSTPTSCGTSPAIDADSTNLAGSFTTGSGTTACTITFTQTWPTRPWCHLLKSDGSNLALTNITDGTTTLVLAGLTASTTYRYWCTGGD